MENPTMEQGPRPADIKVFARLLSGALEGSEEAWQKLFERIETTVRRHCFSHKPESIRTWLHDSDLVQEVALKVNRKLAQFHGQTPQEFIVWVTAITQNLIDDYYRKYRSFERRAGKELSVESMKDKGEELPAPQDEAEVDEETITKCLQALDQLTPSYQQVIELRIKAGLAFNEIGARLGCSGQAAKKLYYRAVQIIRQELRGGD